MNNNQLYRAALKAALQTYGLKESEIVARDRSIHRLFARWSIIDVISKELGPIATHYLADKLQRDRATITCAKNDYKNRTTYRREWPETHNRFKKQFERIVRGNGESAIASKERK